MEQNGPTYVFKKFNRLLSMPEQATVGTKVLASHTFNIIGVHILITCHEVWINTAVLMCLFLNLLPRIYLVILVLVVFYTEILNIKVDFVYF